MAEETNGAGTPAKKEVESVKMGDGRTVEFAGKRKLLKSTIIEGKKVGARFDFRNGETREYWAPDELVLRFAGHGIEQKYGDETAGVEDVDDMVLACDELDGRIQKGEWSIKREGGGMAGTSILLRALVEFSGKANEQVKAFLTGKTQAEKLALRGAQSRNSAGVSVKEIVDRLESEKVAKAAKVDTGSLLSALA